MGGILQYAACTIVLCLVHFKFALWYWIYAFFEGHILISAISYTWHAFIDPDDVENEYINSVTILEGQYNILNQDYHVFHHKYPGRNWWDAPASFQRCLPLYKKYKGSLFTNTQTFELFFIIILADYDAMAERFVDLEGKMTK